MRSINLIVIHCSATRCDRPYPVTQLIRDHDKRFGFTGYHYYIRRDGTVYNTRHVQLVGAHAAGFNEHSIGVCYEGGLDSRGLPADTRTKAQKIALLRLLAQLREAYPQAVVKGHRELEGVHKDCPCFDCSEYRTPPSP